MITPYSIATAFVAVLVLLFTLTTCARRPALVPSNRREWFASLVEVAFWGAALLFAFNTGSPLALSLAVISLALSSWNHRMRFARSGVPGFDDMRAQLENRVRLKRENDIR